MIANGDIEGGMIPWLHRSNGYQSYKLYLKRTESFLEQSGGQDVSVTNLISTKNGADVGNFGGSAVSPRELLHMKCMNKIPLLCHCNISPLQAFLSSGNGMLIEPEPPPVVKIIWSVKDVDILDRRIIWKPLFF